MEADSLAALMALAPQLLNASRAEALLRCAAEAGGWPEAAVDGSARNHVMAAAAMRSQSAPMLFR